VKQSALTNKNSLDFKSQIRTSNGRMMVLALADGRISQVDNSSVRVDINLSNPTVTPLTAMQKGFVCVTGAFSSHPRQHPSRERGLRNKGPARHVGRSRPGRLGAEQQMSLYVHAQRNDPHALLPGSFADGIALPLR
jgi:hypothetical protein